MTTKHTKGPWRSENAMSSDFNKIRYITGPDCEKIAEVQQTEYYNSDTRMPQGEALANAAFIVRACNSHYELLEALEAAKKLMQKSITYENADTYNVIDKAIKNATEQN